MRTPTRFAEPILVNEQATMYEHRGFAGTVEADDGAFVGRVIGLRDVVTFEGATYAEVEQALRESIHDHLASAPNAARLPTGPIAARFRCASSLNCTGSPPSAPSPKGSA